MKAKWKLCVMSGSIMVFVVLGALILAQTIMSSADGRGKEFRLTEGTAGQVASGSVVSGSAAAGNSEQTDVSASCGLVKEKASVGQQIADYAQRFLGIPYVYGGTKLPEEPAAFSYVWSEEDGEDVKDVKLVGKMNEVYGDEYGVDCSGLVQGIFGEFQIKLPRSVKDQAEQGREVKLKDIRPGDIVFYGTSNAKVTHCGIYVGKDKIVHVSARTKFVTVSDMNYRRIAKVVRVVEK